MNKSAQMARVRSKNTQPELLVRSALTSRGIRYRLHRKDLPGMPDIYIGRLHLAIFVNGCFWHGHDCSRGRRPYTNAAFWDAKINRNRERDIRVETELQARGIEVIVLWSCTIVNVLESQLDAIKEQYLKAGIGRKLS